MRKVRSFLVVAAVVVGLIPVTGFSAEDTQVPCVDPRGCPDLYVATDYNEFYPFEYPTPSTHWKEFKQSDCQVQEGMIQAGKRRVLRFEFTTPNLGPGDLIVGSPSDHPEWFEYSSCHNHYHFRQYADYRLWTPAQYAQWDAFRKANPELDGAEALAASGLKPVRGDKRGFCVVDIVPYGPGVAKYFDCGGRFQGVDIPGTQGISVNWADEYTSDLDGQFIDITGLSSGTYVLESEVNAERLYEETSYQNNRARFSVNI
ncbi:MAG: lysyl oxidase family protein [Acidimicrobiia bacterium]